MTDAGSGQPQLTEAGAAMLSATSPAIAPLRPIGEPERLPGLDVLRGVAMLGIFFVNMQLFAMPFMEGFGLVSLPDAPRSEQVVWILIQIVCQYKFISLFSLLFGAGVAMQQMRAAAAGRPFVGVFLRRMATLACFGLLHAILLWYGDILFVYALLGTVLLLLVGWSARALLTAAAVCLAVSIVMSSGLGAMSIIAAGHAGGAPSADVEPALPADEATAETTPAETPSLELTEEPTPAPTGWKAISDAGFQPSNEIWIAGEIQAYKHGPLRDALTYRLVSYSFALVSLPLSYGWRVMAMFLLGAALMKLGFFASRPSPWHGRLMAVGLGVGLPLELASAAMTWSSNFELGWLAVASTPLHEIGSAFLCMGYTGLVMRLVSRREVGPVGRAVANLGRMALTVYLLETIVSTALMYWWGGGWFDEVSRVEQLGLVAAIYAGLLIFSNLWLRWAQMGPFEWLWRSITYWRLPPLRRTT